MSDLYVLKDGIPVKEPDITKWAEAQEETINLRRMGDETINGVRISTVFLGLDHQNVPGGPPILYETMIFGGTHDQYQERYTHRAEAVAGHLRAVSMVKSDPINLPPGAVNPEIYAPDALLLNDLAVKLKVVTEQRDMLLAACKDAKRYLEPDLVEPGRSVFWNLVDAIKAVEKGQS